MAPESVIVRSSGLVDIVCAVVRSEGVKSAANTLISSAGNVAGALLGQVVVTGIADNCPFLVKQGVKVVRSVLATVQPSRTPAISSISVYLGQLDALRVGAIGNRLGASPEYVRASRDLVCAAVRRDDNAAGAINQRFSNARVVHLEAMNAFIRLLVDTCGGIDESEANFITGAALNLVLANTYQRDLDPPVVLIYGTSGQRYTDGTTIASARFRMFDRGGLQSCDIMLWHGGSWHPRAGNCNSHSVRLTAGTRYAWAFRATDRSGHVSQWVVTSTGTA